MLMYYESNLPHCSWSSNLSPNIDSIETVSDLGPMLDLHVVSLVLKRNQDHSKMVEIE